MTWLKRYLPPNAKTWQGRKDTPPNSCLFQLIKQHSLHHALPVVTQYPTFALIGFCSDTGIKRNLGRVGAFSGPLAIRERLAKLATHQPRLRCYDVGDIICQHGRLEESQQALGEAVAYLLKQGYTPIVLGGGHEMAFGHYQGIIQSYARKKLGIINFDAHFDMRPLPIPHKGSSGTPFLQIAQLAKKTHTPFDYTCIGIQPASNTTHLFEIAKKYRVHTVLADSIHAQQTKAVQRVLKRALRHNQSLYLTLCLDVFASSVAPGVSAPQSLGLTPMQVIPLLRQCIRSQKIF